MTAQETTRFEIYARSRGYNTNKEGGRYCEGIVNLMRDAWSMAQKETYAMRTKDAPERRCAGTARAAFQAQVIS